MAKGSTLVIYHAGCFDGFCAAWLFKKAFPDAVFHAAQYGTDPPVVSGKDVCIVDFSYKRPVMRQILSDAHAVVVLDHHKTAQAELAGLVDEFVQRPDLIANPSGSLLPIIRFDMNKSGGRLAWEFLYGNQMLPDEMLATNKSGYSLGVAPWLVDFTEDRDLWRWKLPLSQEINASLRTLPLDFVAWDLLEANPDATKVMAVEGAAIRRAEKQIVDTHVRNAREIELAGHKILSVNATVLSSEIAGELAKAKCGRCDGDGKAHGSDRPFESSGPGTYPGACPVCKGSGARPFGACWFQRQDGKQQWSLRSRDGGIDVSAIAKQFGGGGHPQASGFEKDMP